MSDNVNHPKHYNAGKIEVIEFLEDQFMNRPHEWNAVKYLARADKKGREAEDLEKAIWYIRRKLELLTTNPRRPNDMAPAKEGEVRKPQSYSFTKEELMPKELELRNPTCRCGHPYNLHDHGSNGGSACEFIFHEGVICNCTKFQRAP